MFKFDIAEISVSGLLGLAVSGLALFYALKERNKIAKVCDNLDRSIKDLCNKDVAIDITDEVVDMVVREKVGKEVGRLIPKAAEEGRKQAISSFKDAVQREINAQYNDTKSEVRRAVQEKVGHIDINAVKRQVIEDAKEEAADRFRDELDGVLDNFNDELANIKKIYASIAQKISE